MANSRFEYVRQFETVDSLLLNTWIVLRIDGRSFHKFSKVHEFQKPNDENALNLMTKCALSMMHEFQDIVISYGQSDEYSFLLPPFTQLFKRRASKLISVFVSYFSSSYIYYWNDYFPSLSIKYPPSFDARVVCYPTLENVIDYFRWRQADCHINNLYNTCFWALVNSGESKMKAESILSKTLAKDKNELLFSRFQINYNNLPPLYRRGTFLVADAQGALQVLHQDLMKSEFWETYSHCLQTKKTNKIYKQPNLI